MAITSLWAKPHRTGFWHNSYGRRPNFCFALFGLNSELVIVQLLKSYCLPFLLYTSEAVSPSHSIVHSLDNCINRAIVKIFHVTSSDCVQTIRHSVGLLHVQDLIEKKRLNFVNGLLNDIRFTGLYLVH